MPATIEDDNLRGVIALSEQMLLLASVGDEHRRDAGCGAVYGVLRDVAYRVRTLAEKELERHRVAGTGS